MDYKFEQNEAIGRSTVKILEDELENVAHFIYGQS